MLGFLMSSFLMMPLLVVVIGGAVYCSCCFRARDLPIVKRFFRIVGVDKFDTLNLTIFIAKVTFTGLDQTTLVRVIAGEHEERTFPSSGGNFLCPLQFRIEQGVEEIVFDLMDESGYEVLATLVLDPIQDIHVGSDSPGFGKSSFSMTSPNNSCVTKVSISLGIRPKGISGSFNVLNKIEADGRMELEQAFDKVVDELHDSNATESLSDFEVAVRASSGAVMQYSSWGRSQARWIAVQGPPDQAAYVLGIWMNEDDWRGGKRPLETISLLRVLSVQPAPSTPQAFRVNWMLTPRQRSGLTFERLDRSRDAWVDLLGLVIELVHKEREDRLARIANSHKRQRRGGRH